MLRPTQTSAVKYRMAAAGSILILQPKGKKSWAVRYRHDGQPRKLTLQGFPPLATARRLAAEAREQVGNRLDPAADKQATSRAQRAAADAAIRVEDGFRYFLANHTRKPNGRAIRGSTKAETARLLGFRRDPANPGQWITTGNGVVRCWQKKKLQDVTKADVRALVNDLAKTTPVTANRTLAAVKSFFNFCVRNDILPASPCLGVPAPAPEGGGRERVLSDAELGALWRAAEQDGYPHGDMIRLLILTSCRRDEAREASWAEFDLDNAEWLLPGNRTKNGREHLVPLAPVALTIVKAMLRVGNGKHVFTLSGNRPIHGMSKVKKRLDATMAHEFGRTLERWTIHDLRRTAATGLQRLGVRQEVTEAVLNYASGTVSGVARIYSRHNYAAEKRVALEAWAQHVMTLVADRPRGTVVARSPSTGAIRATLATPVG